MIHFKLLAADGTTELLSNNTFSLLLINFVPNRQEQFAVLPFILLSNVASQQWFAFGTLQMLEVCPHAPCDQQYLLYARGQRKLLLGSCCCC